MRGLARSLPQLVGNSIGSGLWLMLVSIFVWVTPMQAASREQLGACGVAFADSVNREVGFNPCYMVVEDVDGDGHLDIVTANCTSQDMSLLFGAGDGRFEPEQRLPLEGRPADIAIGDLDGDGYKDMAVGDANSNYVSLFWGQPGRSFSAPTRVPCPPLPNRLRMRDLDRDGRLDLLLLARTLAGMLVYWGDGTRAPSSYVTLPLPSHPIMLEVADINVDGHLDLATTACSDSLLYVTLGIGGRVFSPPTPALEVPDGELCTLALGDLNGDEFPDAAILDISYKLPTGRLLVAYGTGTGQFAVAAAVDVGPFPIGLGLGDFDRDGLLDFAVTELSFGPVSLIRGGSFELAGTLPGGYLPEVIEVGDLDEDSDPDLVVMNDGGGSVSIYENTRVVHVSSVRYDPSAYQLATPGPSLEATVLLAPQVGLDLDPSQVALLCGGKILGQATSVAVTDSTSREVEVRFDRQILASIEPGLETLSAFGCDRQGVSFRAASTLKVLPRRHQTLWQASLPGVLPVLIQVPDQSDPVLVVRIYDSSGRLVRVQRSPVGPDRRIAWNGRSSSGDRVPSAVYFAVVEQVGRRESCKLVVLR